MRNKCAKLIRSFENVIKQYGKLTSAMEAAETLIKFKGFEELPTLTFTAGGEIFLTHNFKEMTTDEIIEIMQTKGYITPEDF